MRNLVLSVLGAAALSLSALSLSGCADAARQSDQQAEHARMAECCEHAHAQGKQCTEGCCQKAMAEQHACQACMDAKCGTSECASMAHCEGMGMEKCTEGAGCCGEKSAVEGQQSCPAAAATATEGCGACPGKVQG